jgi:hypothetical protein
MKSDDLRRCIFCGAILVEAAWNKEVDLLYCPNYECLKGHHPQWKRYKPTGRMEMSQWILNTMLMREVTA